MGGRLGSWPPAEIAPADVLPGSVAAIMTGVLKTVSVDASLEEAQRLMRHYEIHHLLLEDRGHIVAVVSDRNLARALGPTLANRDQEHRRHRPVFQAAQYHLVTVHHETSVEDAARLLLDEDVSSLPVVNGADEIVGMITSRDLLRELASRGANWERLAS
ncbi:MAG: CBS domain-containing protein [Dehalococcoidia bacterium]